MALAGIIVAISACTTDVAESTSTVAISTSIVTLNPENDPVDADLPDDYLDDVLADLESLTGLDRAQFSVLDDSAVEWADQRLGCVHLPEPSDPMPVDGYRILIDTGQAQYDYRLDDMGMFHLCGDPVDIPEVPDEDDHDEREEGLEEESS